MPLRPEGIDIEGMTQIGDKLRAQGDDAGAANFYQRALQRMPKDKMARINLAEILEAHGDLAGAAAQYRTGLDQTPDNPDLLRGYGRVLLKQGDATGAKDEYEKALRVDSEDIKALNGLGVSLDYLGQHSAAQQAYNEALIDAPNDMTTIANLGHSYVLTGAYDDAIRILEPHALDKSATPALRQNLAEAYGMSGMDVDAERMGRMDLSASANERNLAYYHARRAKLALVPRLYADLGAFPTEAMANAHKDEIVDNLMEGSESIVITVRPALKSIGGTPSFEVNASGFSTAAKLHAFCDHAKKAGMVCKPHEG